MLFCLLFLCVFSVITTSYYGLYRPVFHSHRQSIDLKQVLRQVPSAKIYHNNKEIGSEFSLFRSWSNQDIVIKQEGFKDCSIALPTKWTEDNWGYEKFFSSGGRPVSKLLVPIHTLYAGAYPPVGFLLIPLGLFFDIGNIVSLPLLPIINPWKEYDVSALEKQIILEPTDELKKNCNKDGYFISNIGCTSCLYEEPVVASKGELKRCQNRFNGFSFSKNFDIKTTYSYPCSTQTGIVSTEEECQQCMGCHMVGRKCIVSCPENQGIKGYDEKCHPCDEEEPFATSDIECKKCPNRKMFENADCGLSECPENHIHDRNGFCYSCAEPHSVWTWNEKECAKCPYAQMVNPYTCQIFCPPDKPLPAYDGKCHSCDDPDFLKVDKEYCDKCSNRRMLETSYQRNNFYCVLACPPEKPLQDYKGNCYTCDDETAVFTADEDCNKCPNRRMLSNYCLPACQTEGSIQNYKGSCYSCDEEKVILDIPEEECNKCPNREMAGWSRCAVKCPADKPMRNDEGKCYSCDDDDEVWFDKEECKKCVNRQYDGDICTIKVCPPDRPLRGINGKCHSCDEKRSISIGDITQQKICSEICPNRTIWRINGSCINTNCPIYDLDGNCFSCDEEQAFRTDKQECDKCPQRKYKDWKCYNKNAVISENADTTTYGTVPEGDVGGFNIIVIDPTQPLDPNELIKRLGL